ncbi:protein Skeletor, isoforms B/C-like [Lytechinus pictus]|uniref:protein Skeletor, isoforms B/C-like n=1 Tax=Lytechinus pictus TaxID=7653 RepID=UPI0030BA2073
MKVPKLLLAAVISTVLGVCYCDEPYYGKLIGEFRRQGSSPSSHHGVTGTVYAVDRDTLQIINFSYDGLAPDAFFYIGTSGTPSANGFEIPKANGHATEKLGVYNNEDLTIHLDTSVGPDSLSDYVWISVWCKQAGANFADVTIESGFIPPAEYPLGELRGQAHGVDADNVIILNSKEIRFVGLDYDGGGPDAYFWTDVVSPPTANGNMETQVGESSPSRLPRERLTSATRTVRLETDVFSIKNIGLWCVAARQNFGHINIPAGLKADGLIIPALPASDVKAYDNCAVLKEDQFQVSWTVDGDQIEISLVSRQGINEYMAFGPSGSDSRTIMTGSDVAVAYINDAQMGVVDDYYLEAYGMCTADGDGVCPDTVADGQTPGTNDITFLGYYRSEGITRINYRRPLLAGDGFDKDIRTTGSQYISWALGPINSDGRATKHTSRTLGDMQIEFGMAMSTCPPLTINSESGNFVPFEVEPIEALKGTEFTCNIGSSGGPQGYEGITSSVGWGIAWYINGNLIPEITVRRNQTYSFKVYGGSDPGLSASYHPFYITDSPAGGYDQISETEKEDHIIYAGPTTGSYCTYDETAATGELDGIFSYKTYRDTLEYICPDDAVAGILEWTPDDTTPDVVYYQCYTHRYLGWKINVVDDANKVVLSLITMVTALIFSILVMSRND